MISFESRAAVVVLALSLVVVVFVVFTSIRAWRERQIPNPVSASAYVMPAKP